jgi:hypothetical protein
MLVRRMLSALLFLGLSLSPFPSALAQSTAATLSGTVADETGAVVAGAKITVVNVDTALRRETTTNDSGYFTVPLLPPGKYSVSALRSGFSPVDIRDIALNVNDERSLRIQLKAGNVSDTVTITAESAIQESPAVNTVVDRQFVENLPLNGRSFQSLITLTPGIVLTPSATTGVGEEAGQFSVNGQRGNANYFTVDGISANTGMTPAFLPLQPAAGGIPQSTATGTTMALVSLDAMQEFKIQTSTYAPEFGRTPGAQIQITTRSGSNVFHGTVFEYFRNDKLDANDWFANQAGLPKPQVRQNDFGGVFSGPLIKDRTFFFFSYEGLRLRQPAVSTIPVPSLDARSTAPAAIRSILDAYPVPNGRNLGNQISELTASYSNPSSSDAIGIRVDHTINDRITIFGRYSYTPSNGTVRRTDTNLEKFPTDVNSESLTAGATFILSPHLANDLRANYTWSNNASSLVPDAFGGAVVPDAASIFSNGFGPQNAVFGDIILGSGGLLWGRLDDNRLRQFNIVDDMSLVKGSHALKFGVDYRHLSPELNSYSQLEINIFNGVTGALTAKSLVSEVLSVDQVGISLKNLSIFAQDTWKATSRLTLTYGLRWELNPPPTGNNGKTLYTIRGLDSPGTLFLAPAGTPLWATTYNNFAPRFGLAYQLGQNRNFETILRAGAGVFYDTGTGSAGAAGHSAPYIRELLLPGQPYPLSPSVAGTIPFSLNPPYGQSVAAVPNLKLPYTVEWNVSAEQLIGPNQSVKVSYVGAAGRRLLFTQDANFNNINPNFGFVLVSTNAATSDYHALQVQYQRRLSHGLQALASYTWSHSIDNSSGDGNVVSGESPAQDRGPSDFDFRHQVSGAIVYDIPAPELGRVARAVLRDWSSNLIFSARSAAAVNVLTIDPSGAATSFDPRPNLVPGVPLYVYESDLAGGRRINSAAFTNPGSGQQGDLGRNALRGFGFWQLDLALHRRFRMTERVGLEFRAEFFNIFNHPNFASPVSSLDNPLFGQSTQMLGTSLNGSSGAGLNPLFQIGRPRSMQLALKLNF